MMVAQSVAAILADHARLSVECIDRMYLNVYVPKLQRDNDVAWFFRGHRRQRFDDAEGVVFIGKAQEKAPVFRTEKRRSPNGQSYPWIVRSTAMVNQYYVYAVDRDFAPLQRQVLPERPRVCQAQLAKADIAFEALDNGIHSCVEA